MLKIEEKAEECKEKYFECFDQTLLTTLDDSICDISTEVNALPLPKVTCAVDASVVKEDIVVESDAQVEDVEPDNNSCIYEDNESSTDEDDEKLESQNPSQRNYSKTKLRQAIKKELKKLFSKYSPSEPGKIDLRPKPDAEGNQKERFCSRKAEDKSVKRE